jgi:hypothetical protein
VCVHVCVRVYVCVTFGTSIIIITNTLEHLLMRT